MIDEPEKYRSAWVWLRLASRYGLVWFGRLVCLFVCLVGGQKKKKRYAGKKAEAHIIPQAIFFRIHRIALYVTFTHYWVFRWLGYLGRKEYVYIGQGKQGVQVRLKHTHMRRYYLR